MKMRPGPANAEYDCRSVARYSLQLKQPIGKGAYLSFYLKSVPHARNQFETTYSKMIIRLFECGEQVARYDWQNSDVIDDFVKVIIPIQATPADQVSISIVGAARNTPVDGCDGESISWFDGLEINQGTSVAYGESDCSHGLSVYPNPSNGRVYVQSQFNRWNQYQIFDPIGNEIQSGEIHNSMIELEVSGMYLLVVRRAEFPEDYVSRWIIIL
jgi:hypothetical protein